MLIEPPSLKIHTYFDIKHLHSARIVQAVSFIGRWVTAHLYLCVLKLSSIWYIPSFLYH